MADPIDEVSVVGADTMPKKRRYPGLSPLQAGLAYGGAAATVMGPLGLLIGLGSGIVAGRMRKSWLDREAASAQRLRSEQLDSRDEINREMAIADPDERRLIQHSRLLESAGWEKLYSGDPEGRSMIEKAQEIRRGIMTADIQARKADEAQAMQFQRGLIGTAANAYREEFQKNQSQFEDINSQADRVLKLAASAGFDPNKPFNKAVMTDLLTVGVGGLYRDAPDLLGSIPFVGEMLERGSDALTGKFDLTVEDYNRVALSMKHANELVSENRMVRLGEQARQLDDQAHKLNAVPQDYSLGEYVSGGVSELRFTEDVVAPTSKVPGTRSTLQGPTGLFSDSETARRIEQWVQKKVGPPTKKPRPTN